MNELRDDPVSPRRSGGCRGRVAYGSFADASLICQEADRLGVGKETVKTHVSRTLMKLGARSRAQAVSAAPSRGFL